MPLRLTGRPHVKALTTLTIACALALTAIVAGITTHATQAEEKKTMEFGNYSAWIDIMSDDPVDGLRTVTVGATKA